MKKNADVIMNLGISSIGISTLQYDREGYNKLYKATVYIKVDYFRKKMKLKEFLQLMGNMIFLLMMEQQLVRQKI